MNEITRNRFRPIIVTIFWCHFFFNGIEFGSVDGELLSEVFLLIILSSMLIFKIREKISIENEFLIFDLHKTKLVISIKEIKEITFFDCFNVVEVKTVNSSSKLNISQFHSKKVEAFFTENCLYKFEANENIEYNQTFQRTR